MVRCKEFFRDLRTFLERERPRYEGGGLSPSEKLFNASVMGVMLSVNLDPKVVWGRHAWGETHINV